MRTVPVAEAVAQIPDGASVVIGRFMGVELVVPTTVPEMAI
jgi:hypothetical protein